MNGRERLTAVCRHRPADRLAWTALVDGKTLSGLPKELGGNGGLDFYRHLGCDMFLLDGWGTPVGFPSPALRWGPDVRESWSERGDVHVRELATSGSVLTAESRGAHPVKFLVSTVEDLRAYRRLWETARFEFIDDAEPHRRLLGLIGDDGIYTRFWGPSTIPRLLEFDIGVEGFYYLNADHPAEMRALIDTIHGKELEAFRILARSSAEVITLVENTSTYYISPDIYREFNGPHVKDFVRIIQGAGKVAIIHMCGHVRQLLPQIRETGLDGSHALTPPSTGDTPWELALDVLGEDTVILGALPPDLWIMGPVDGIGPALDRLYTPRLRRSHFVLCLFADGIAVPRERFEAVARWMERAARLD